MLEHIQLSYPSYYLYAYIFVALLFAAGMYMNDKRFKNNNWLRPLLAIFRFLGVLGILMLLLNPFVKQNQEEQKDPIIVIAQDQSESIQAGSTNEELQLYNDKIAKIKNALADQFKIDEWSFGDQIRTGIDTGFSDQTTNISQLMKVMDDSYADQNVGAIILASDGIYNEGKNPIYEKTELNAPIYAVALGDTTIKRDITISNLLHNRIAYLGDRFNVQLDVQAFNAAGEKTQINIFRAEGANTTLIAKEQLNINRNNFFKTFNFEIEANTTGNISYRAVITSIKNEVSTRNNNKKFYVETLDARQKILLLASAPHPDLTVLKKIIENNKNYEIDLKFKDDDLTQLRSFDMIIFHNLPSNQFILENILKQIETVKTPLLFIVGSQTALPRFNANQNAIEITGNNKDQNDAQALIVEDFNLFILNDQLKKKLPNFVPLKVPFGSYRTDPRTQVLLNQKIGSVDTDYPLLLFHEQNNQKVGVLAGEGIWRWNLYEYAQYENQETITELFSKLIQFLSKKDDKRRFRAFSSKNNYKQNESIFFDAQLYNQSYELINEPDAFLQIKNEEGQRFDFVLSRTNNYYRLDAGRFAEGNYTYTASTNYNGEQMESKGKFSIQSVQKEQYDLTAKHDILYALSKRNQGDVYYPNNMEALSEVILNNQTIKPILVNNTITEKLLNKKWLALLIAFILFAEWFLRRYFGSY